MVASALEGMDIRNSLFLAMLGARTPGPITADLVKSVQADVPPPYTIPTWGTSMDRVVERRGLSRRTHSRTQAATQQDNNTHIRDNPAVAE